MGQAHKETKYKSPKKNINKRQKQIEANTNLLKKLKQEHLASSK